MKKTAKKTAPRPAVSPPPSGWGIRALLVGVLFLLATAGAWALFEFVVFKAIPAQLAGKWVVTEGSQEGATFDFYRSGKMEARLNQRGRLAIVRATIRVEGDKIFSTTRNPTTGQETTVVQTIRTLTATNLVVEDAKGKSMKMQRAD